MKSMYRPGWNSKDIPVYFIRGKKFNAPGNVNAFAYFDFDINKPDNCFILIAVDEATGELMAHEIGHLLFVRKDDTGTTLFNDNPDTSHQPPGDKSHDDRTDFVMAPKIITTSIKISKPQCEIADISWHIRNTDLIVGYIPQNVCKKIQVEFVSLNPTCCDDEGGTHELKVRFHFEVNGVVQNWDENYFHVSANPYFLSPPLTPFIVDVSNITQFSIHVWGTEIDTGPNDDLPDFKLDVTESHNWERGTNTHHLDNDFLTCELIYKIDCIESGPGDLKPYPRPC